MFCEDFRLAIINSGLHFSDKIIADGKLHRFQVKCDKSGKKNGWYVLYEGDIPAGAFGCWKRGVNETWCSKHRTNLSRAEKSAFKEQMQKAKLLREKETQERYLAAQKKAIAIWNLSKPAPDSYPYLIKKQVKNHGLRLYKNSLVIPVIDIEGNIHSLQFIDENGGKLFLSGGKKKGCYFAIEGAGESLLIAEGYATAATLHEVTGLSIVVCFDAGNMGHVAKAIRAVHPDLDITICADNDSSNSENTGVIKARQAAISIRAKLVMPPCAGDFNDYYVGGAS